MRINFTQKDGGPERLVTEAEILFEEPALSGLKLVGFSIWSSPEGELYVTFPSRAFGSGSERRFFDYIRGVDGDVTAAKALKQAIVAAYKAEKTDPVA
jgi:hypothetical protein